ncbi:unnamed protein product, partial [Didymodactylos carnosus]
SISSPLKSKRSAKKLNSLYTSDNYCPICGVYLCCIQYISNQLTESQNEEDEYPLDDRIQELVRYHFLSTKNECQMKLCQWQQDMLHRMEEKHQRKTVASLSSTSSSPTSGKLGYISTLNLPEATPSYTSTSLSQQTVAPLIDVTKLENVKPIKTYPMSARIGVALATSDKYIMAYEHFPKCLVIFDQHVEHCKLLLKKECYDVIDICWSPFIKEFCCITRDELFTCEPESGLIHEVEPLQMSVNELITSVACSHEQYVYLCYSYGAVIEQWSIPHWKLEKYWKKKVDIFFDNEFLVGSIRCGFEPTDPYLHAIIKDGDGTWHIDLLDPRANMQKFKTIPIEKRNGGFLSQFVPLNYGQGYLCVGYNHMKLIDDSNGEWKKIILREEESKLAIVHNVCILKKKFLAVRGNDHVRLYKL